MAKLISSTGSTTAEINTAASAIIFVSKSGHQIPPEAGLRDWEDLKDAVERKLNKKTKKD